jgi:hypothetical protein
MITNYLDALYERSAGFERAFEALPFESFEITFWNGIMKVCFHAAPETDRWPAIWFPLEQTFDRFVEDHFPNDT